MNSPILTLWSRRPSLRSLAGWLSLPLALATACGAENTDGLKDDDTIVVDDELVETTMGGEELIVDLRDVNRVYRFDPSASELDFAHVLLFCPDGRSMPMDDWLEDQASIVGTNFFFAPGGFTLSARAREEPPITDETCTCEQVCKRCPDGAWICHAVCTGSCDQPGAAASTLANEGSVRDPGAWAPYPGKVPTSPHPRGGGGRPWEGQEGSVPDDHGPRAPSTPSDPPDEGGAGGNSGGNGGGRGGSGGGGNSGGGGSWGDDGRGGGGRPGL